ncbi:type II toxin-antitoxin system HipA family toxin [Roseateles sp. DC23W]|uniref:Type II toxin-antitoxin system HipA family toxin n=1 Tax=Pelomonas dachongensis TaxID=3299029 RepID=A0ABW7EUS6_9BURK
MGEVLLHVPGGGASRRIGWLSKVGDNLRVSFAKEYVQDPQRPTLSTVYRLESDEATRQVLTAINDERLVRIGKLPSYFQNLLPEGINRQRLAERRGVAVSDEFELLAAAGHDLIGGVEVVPAHSVPHDVTKLHATKGLEPLEPSAVASPLDDGWSLGGYVTKFSMVYTGRRYVVRRGTDAGQIIAKLPSTDYPDMVHNEAACYRLAAAVGMEHAGATARPIAELAIDADLPHEFTHYLHVPRFDRELLADGRVQRIHFEELIQALGMDAGHKYRNLGSGIVALNRMLVRSPASGYHQVLEVFRRWTAFALMGGADAHLKNWAVIYRDGINPALAPAYDLVCVSCYFNQADPNQLSMNKAMDGVLRRWTPDAAVAVARDSGLLQVNQVRKMVFDTAAQALEAWPQLLKDAPPRLRKEVTARLAALVPQLSRPDSPKPRGKASAQATPTPAARPRTGQEDQLPSVAKHGPSRRRP